MPKMYRTDNKTKVEDKKQYNDKGKDYNYFFDRKINI